MRLLLIEDDRMIGESVQEALRGAGYVVDWARDGNEGELSLLADVYDLILLDLGLPRKAGLTLLREFRKKGSTVPVLILTARDAIDNKIEGLDAGADDYLTKPFDLEELAARVRALLRRRAGQAQPVFAHLDLEVDPAAHRASQRGEPLALSPREFALLHTLIEMPTKVFSRTELEDKLYGWGDEVGSNTIEVHVHTLRRKIGVDAIVTVRGVGYRMGNPR
jgi:two-component system response regulator QseB